MANPIAVLYGGNPERDHIKTLLTSDNVLRKGELYDLEKPHNSTKQDDYIKWGVYAARADGKQATMNTSIQFGSDTVERKSTQKADFDTKTAQRAASFKPENKINITDMDPAYQMDTSPNTTSYSAEFDKTALADHQAKTKVVIHGSGSSYTKYVRGTHFNFGNDPNELKTEAQAAYSAADGSQSYFENCLAAERALRDKCNNSVFRNGDYNQTKGPDNQTVFTVSYAGAPSTQKGYDHVVNSRTNIKMGDSKYNLSKKLYEFLREKFQNPRDPCQVNLRQAFALFDKNRTGFITYECIRNVLKRLVAPEEQGIADEVIALFDNNKDGKIDYLEFENFLNKQFPQVETEESLYADTYKPSLLEGAAKNRSNEYSPVDGKYHVKTHFRFGEDAVTNSESLYKSSYGGEKKIGRINLAKPLPATQVLPVEPDHVKTASSSQRTDYGDHSKDLGRITGEKISTIASNKVIHDNASFSLAQGIDDKDERSKSLAASSYVPLQLPARSGAGRNRGFETKWNHFSNADTIPEQGALRTEHSDAYHVDSAATGIQDCPTNKHLRTMRVADEKTSHLCFGTDSNFGNTTEMAVQFQGKPVDSGDVSAAGISGGALPQHQLTHHVDTAATTDVMTTVMKSDYRTLDGAVRAKPSQGSTLANHYFHTNNSTLTPGTTTQHDFTHPVDKLRDTAFQTVSSK